jgi:hypothetical protein
MGKINWKAAPDPLEKAKKDKIDELDKKCNETILGNFAYTYSDGNTYYFNNDMLAQGNFDKLLNAFDKGLVDSINWTAYDSEGNVVRLAFDSTSYLDLYKAHLEHINSNIARFRDQLQPFVDKQTTGDKITAVTWETDTTANNTDTTAEVA